MTFPITEINVITASYEELPVIFRYSLLLKTESNKHALERLASSKAPGFIGIPVDLNKEAKGDYVIVVYKREEGGTPISDIVVVEGENTPPPAGYTKIATDLNKGAGGSFLYLCYTKDTAHPPIYDIQVQISNNKRVDNTYAPRYGGEIYTLVNKDLNKEAGGKFIYLYYLRGKGGNSSVVRDPEKVSAFLDGFSHGIDPSLLEDGADKKEYEISRVQLGFDDDTGIDTTLIRFQRLKVKTESVTPGANPTYKYTMTVGSKKEDMEQFSKEIGFNASVEYKAFSAGVNGKMGTTTTSSYETSTEIKEDKEYSPSDLSYSSTLAWCVVEDVLCTVKMPDGEVLKSLVTATDISGVFRTTKEGKWEKVQAH